MTKTTKPDEIRVHSSRLGSPASRVRWTRYSAANGKIIGASSEGYARKRGALANIERTQKQPYTVVIEDHVKG